MGWIKKISSFRYLVSIKLKYEDDFTHLKLESVVSLGVSYKGKGDGGDMVPSRSSENVIFSVRRHLPLPFRDHQEANRLEGIRFVKPLLVL